MYVPCLQMVWWGIGGNVTPIACRLAKRPGLGGVQDYQRVKLTAAAGMSVSTDSSCAHRFELKRLCYDFQGSWLWCSAAQTAGWPHAVASEPRCEGGGSTDFIGFWVAWLLTECARSHFPTCTKTTAHASARGRLVHICVFFVFCCAFYRRCT